MTLKSLLADTNVIKADTKQILGKSKKSIKKKGNLEHVEEVNDQGSMFHIDETLEIGATFQSQLTTSTSPAKKG